VQTKFKNKKNIGLFTFYWSSYLFIKNILGLLTFYWSTYLFIKNYWSTYLFIKNRMILEYKVTLLMLKLLSESYIFSVVFVIKFS